MAKKRDAFDVQLTPEQRQRLGLWACDAVQQGLDARSEQERQVDYWHTLYEQSATRPKGPWKDAADLTSYIAAEKVDALHARIMKTIWTEPVYTVEGWGDAAARAPFVEEFHQWKVEEERLQGVLDVLILQALIEPRGLLEVSEGSGLRTVRKQRKVAMVMDQGAVVFGEDGKPQMEEDADGKPIEVTDTAQPSIDAVVDTVERVRTGPSYRVLPYRDSLILPGHARDKDEIWSYWKRFWKRWDTLKADAKSGRYDVDIVDAMRAQTDRESDDALARAHQTVVSTETGIADKELWEGTALLDLASLLDTFGCEHVSPEVKGERWYILTVHLPTQTLLRLQHDDLERCRFVPVILFPRTDRATEGFSFVGHKLITTIEEHTAVRNARADRSRLQVSAPIKRLQGALWDPAINPFEPGGVIDVRDMREIEPMVIPDVTAQLLAWAQECERTADRLAGVNDIASGQVARENRTLGEIQMATEQSFVRMDLIVRRFQEAMEDIGQIRHQIWTRALADQGDQVDPSPTMLANLEGRSVSIDEFLPDGKVTADLLAGAFRFKPHGSVETADPNQQRNGHIGFMQSLKLLQEIFPAAAPMFRTPQAARAAARQTLRVFKVPNEQAFIGSAAQEAMTIQQAGTMAPAPLIPPPPPMPMPGMPGMPGMAPGMPPGMAPGGPPMGGGMPVPLGVGRPQ